MAKAQDLLDRCQPGTMLAEDLFDKSITQIFNQATGRYEGFIKEGTPGIHIAKHQDENGNITISINPSQQSLF
jgi:hypothetical protein